MLKIGLIVGSTRPNRFADDYVYVVQARQALFDNLAWWAGALKDARAEQALAA